jgi:hypothetical protein
MHVPWLPLEDFITHLLHAQETAHYYNFSNIRYTQPPLVNWTVVNDSQAGVVWIYGSGFFTEPKESQGNPAGLVANLH